MVRRKEYRGSESSLMDALGDGRLAEGEIGVPLDRPYLLMGQPDRTGRPLLYRDPLGEGVLSFAFDGGTMPFFQVTSTTGFVAWSYWDGTIETKAQAGAVAKTVPASGAWSKGVHKEVRVWSCVSASDPTKAGTLTRFENASSEPFYNLRVPSPIREGSLPGNSLNNPALGYVKAAFSLLGISYCLDRFVDASDLLTFALTNDGASTEVIHTGDAQFIGGIVAGERLRVMDCSRSPEVQGSFFSGVKLNSFHMLSEMQDIIFSGGPKLQSVEATGLGLPDATGFTAGGSNTFTDCPLLSHVNFKNGPTRVKSSSHVVQISTGCTAFTTDSLYLMLNSMSSGAVRIPILGSAASPSGTLLDGITYTASQCTAMATSKGFTLQPNNAS